MLNKLTILSIKNSPWISSWMNQFCNSTDLMKAGMYKRSGSSVMTLLRLLVGLPMVGIPIYQFKKTELPVPGRDSFYRMLEHPGYNWRLLLYRIATKLITYFSTLIQTDTRRVLIVDDSSYKRNRSSHVQYLGRQRDHSEHRYYNGFRMLTLAWSDSHSCLPCEFELLTNAEAAKRIGPEPSIDRRTAMGQRVKAATTKATQVTVQMVRRALRYLPKVDCVVFDSWFCLPSVIAEIASDLPVICRAKNIRAIQFKHNQRILSLEGVYNHVKNTAWSGHRLDSVIGWTTLELLNVGNVKVVFIENKDNSTGWSALICTNTTLSAERIIQYYAQRWDIEVCFKALKKHLNLYELQQRNYSSIVAYTSVVFIRYMMICYYHRCCKDQRTLPGMFYHCVEQLQASSVAYCITLLQIKLIEQILAKPLQSAYHLACNITQTIQNFITIITHFSQSRITHPLTATVEYQTLRLYQFCCCYCRSLVLKRVLIVIIEYK